MLQPVPQEILAPPVKPADRQGVEQVVVRLQILIFSNKTILFGLCSFFARLIEMAQNYCPQTVTCKEPGCKTGDIVGRYTVVSNGTVKPGTYQFAQANYVNKTDWCGYITNQPAVLALRRTGVVPNTQIRDQRWQLVSPTQFLCPLPEMPKTLIDPQNSLFCPWTVPSAANGAVGSA